MRGLCAAIVSGLLLSCAMGPDYSRPDIPTADSFRMAEEGHDLPSLANMPWWELYQDQELQTLIKISLEENKDLERAVATVEEYEARLFIARTDFAPQMTGTVNAPVARQGGVRFRGFPNPFNYYVQGNLSWEIDLWGRIRRSNEAARGDLLAREENRRAIILQLVGGVAQAYFDLRQFDLQLEISQRTLLAWEESVRIGKARHRQGLINRLDVDQFEAERENAAARIADLKRQMIQKENELSILLGRNPGHIPRGQTLTEQIMPPVIPAGLPSELLQRRPDVVQAEQQLAAATARIGAAKADRFPKISLTGILGIANPSLSKLYLPQDLFGALGPGVTAPLLNAQILGFQQEATQAQERQALAQYKQTILVAFREVEDALAGVTNTRDQASAQERQVNALRSALRLANLRYKGGLANYLDVLIAQRSLFDAELALVATRRLYLTSVVQLYKALGGGWSPDEHGRVQPVSATTDAQ
ncbi:RND efflux system, outer membrane factor lipoprotein [Nitrospira sp. KM1]|uniref:efflux transporter outer membrane subunit n=1 Tax=Nitrospira sp. KM1 TaxID=1936990 RepID=UPI0013A7622F|nr:efflux transporter outer membrane subunit [Nitrospira sp. KM1]BCA55264.1 RND efflux system, outer membrane factor lipoprotein [Nitrospira sp. KM1]